MKSILNKILRLAIVVLTFTSCQDKLLQYASISTLYETLELKGPVKSYLDTTFNVHGNNIFYAKRSLYTFDKSKRLTTNEKTEIVKSKNEINYYKKDSHVREIFDYSTNAIEEITYNADGAMNERRIFSYYRHNNKSLLRSCEFFNSANENYLSDSYSYNDDGQLTYAVRTYNGTFYHYDFNKDFKGNIIECVGMIHLKEFTFYDKTTYTYDLDNVKETETLWEYDRSKKSWSKTEFRSYKKGRLTSVEYFKDGKSLKLQKFVYKFDEYDNIVDKKEYVNGQLVKYDKVVITYY